MGKVKFTDECYIEAARVSEDARKSSAISSSLDALAVIKSKLTKGTVYESTYKIA